MRTAIELLESCWQPFSMLDARNDKTDRGHILRQMSYEWVVACGVHMRV